MDQIILVDLPDIHTSLQPLTFTRPISRLLIGLDTIDRKWNHALNTTTVCRTADYLDELFPTPPDRPDQLLISSHILPDPELCRAIKKLSSGECLTDPSGNPIAARDVSAYPDATKSTVYTNTFCSVQHPYDLFLLNGQTIETDFTRLTQTGTRSSISPTCTIIGNPANVFIHETARVEGAMLNCTGGPIYIGPGAEVMEGSCLRGPIGILDHATVNMGTKIYGASTIGQHCKVGGELNNVVLHPYSNKAHDGFLGNAVIGSWCNLGAGCVASNLKNDYTEIRLWDYASRRFLRTGLQFCGLIMADHSKAGINTMFNTATVCGVGVNIHGSGYPRNFVASFSEGSASTGFTEVPLSKFFAIAERVMARRDIPLTDAYRRLFTHLHAMTEYFR